MTIDQKQSEDQSGIWTSSHVGGQINFYVVMSSYLNGYINDDNNILVHFLETLYQINVDKTSGFEVSGIKADRTVATDGGQTELQYVEEISAYQCNDEFLLNCKILLP